MTRKGSTMSHEWDEFAKLLAESVPRRESLRRLGFLCAGAVLTPLGLGTAWAGGTDPCRSFCNRCPYSRRSSCLAACRACNNQPSRLCGNCSSGYFCTDFLHDVHNCGACFDDCWSGAGANEEAVCFNGECVYDCVEGAVDCNGTCLFLDSDPHNCGACGHVCPDTAPYCNQGACYKCVGGAVDCNGTCTDLGSDPHNCGACGNVCPNTAPYCNQGVCVDTGCAPGLTYC